MEKRMHTRNSANILVDYSLFGTQKTACKIAGTMINCSASGTCIRSNFSLDKGAIILVRILKYPPDLDANVLNDIRTIGLAEVKWTRPLNHNGGSCFGAGLKYLN